MLCVRLSQSLLLYCWAYSMGSAYNILARPSWSLARQQPMLKLEVEYYLQLEDVKQYYFLHNGTKHHCKLISKNQAN